MPEVRLTVPQDANVGDVVLHPTRRALGGTPLEGAVTRVTKKTVRVLWDSGEAETYGAGRRRVSALRVFVMGSRDVG